MSRPTEVYKTLEYRNAYANSSDATYVKGVETYYYKFVYRPLAGKVHEEIITSKTYTRNRGVKKDNFHVITSNNISCID